MMSNARRLFLQGVAAGVAGGISGLIQQALAADAIPVRPGIRRFQGIVTVNGSPGRAGMLVRPGDTVETGPKSEVIYVIGEDAFLQRADTRASFGAETAAAFMRVVTGKILSVFGKRERRRNLLLPTATIGIRGTGCYIESGARRSYFCLCYGEVELQAKHERPLVYQTQHHENPLWIENGITARAPVINHTDAELAMLEALVDRQPPFSPFGGGKY